MGNLGESPPSYGGLEPLVALKLLGSRRSECTADSSAVSEHGQTNLASALSICLRRLAQQPEGDKYRSPIGQAGDHGGWSLRSWLPSCCGLVSTLFLNAVASNFKVAPKVVLSQTWSHRCYASVSLDPPPFQGQKDVRSMRL